MGRTEKEELKRGKINTGGWLGKGRSGKREGQAKKGWEEGAGKGGTYRNFGTSTDGN